MNIFVLRFCKIFVFYQRLYQVFIQSSIQTADLKAEEVLKLVANISYQNTGSTAEIVVSWHPGWEEVETDRGNGGESSIDKS